MRKLNVAVPHLADPSLTDNDGKPNQLDYARNLRRATAMRPRAAPNSITVDPPSGTVFEWSPLKRVRLENPPFPLGPVPLLGKVYLLLPLRAKNSTPPPGVPPFPLP